MWYNQQDSRMGKRLVEVYLAWEKHFGVAPGWDCFREGYCHTVTALIEGTKCSIGQNIDEAE
jgi:hypothetical protein